MIITSENVNLTNCAKEQIHIPNSIQPHGALVIIDRENFTIIQASHNTEDIIGFHNRDLMNKPIENVLSHKSIKLIRDCLNCDFSAINPIRIDINNRELNLIVHENKDFIFLEFEPINSNYKNDFINFYQLTNTTLEQIQKSKNLQELAEVIVKNIRQLTGFDRVLVYRFDNDESGNVIAEEKREDLESFMGLRYPATDVPKPARRLYLLNYIRLIPDIDCENIPLPPHPETKESFDLSLVNLRTVSPIHVEYLHNMGVRASMSISLIHENKLWGLIACHHYSPRFLPYEVRVACEFLGKVMSLNLVAKEDQENLETKIKLQNRSALLFNNLCQSLNIKETLLDNIDLLASFVEAQGMVLSLNGELTSVGITPEENELQNLIEWLKKEYNQNLFYTDSLGEIYAPSHKFKNIASGILVLFLNRIDNSYLIWFRPEVEQTVKWAGNPHKNVTVEDDGSLTLSPRKSFELWKQTVEGKSLQWEDYQIKQVQEFRNLLVDIIFKKSHELAELNLELQKSNEELDAFAYIASHDLKEPLRGIFNYSYLLIEDYENQLDEDGQRKIQTLMTLTKRMEKFIDALLHFSRLGRKEPRLETIDIEKLINNEIKLILEASYQEKLDIRIPRKLPQIEGDPTMIEEVFMNLINNAFKYNDKEQKWVEIGYILEEKKSPAPIFYVKDNGIGIEQEHLELIFRIFKRLHGPKKFGGGTGAGLTIVKRIIERHGGQIWVESIYGQETTFYFTIAKA